MLRQFGYSHIGRIYERELLCDERADGLTSTVPDQGIEQETRTRKVIGGIVGITQN